VTRDVPASSYASAVRTVLTRPPKRGFRAKSVTWAWGQRRTDVRIPRPGGCGHRHRALEVPHAPPAVGRVLRRRGVDDGRQRHDDQGPGDVRTAHCAPGERSSRLASDRRTPRRLTISTPHHREAADQIL